MPVFGQQNACLTCQTECGRQNKHACFGISDGLAVADAADTCPRILHVTGGPGTGKTEVIIAAAQAALQEGCRVLIAGPIGLLMSMYKLRLPADDNLVLETIHSAFKIVRDADAQYSPPGRLKTFDLIIFDEVSQIDSLTWNYLKIAMAELTSKPYIVFRRGLPAAAASRRPAFATTGS